MKSVSWRTDEYYLSHIKELKKESDKRLKLLRRSKDWLESYLEYFDSDIPLLGEPNKSVAKLIDELAEELGDVPKRPEPDVYTFTKR